MNLSRLFTRFGFMFLIAAACSPPAFAQELDPGALFELLKPQPPIVLPADAVIIPYDADGGVAALGKAEKVLVPKEKYVELWNRAFPDKKLEAAAPSVPISLAGAAYASTLSDDQQLLLAGHFDVDVFVETPVQIPLPLSGAVLAAATSNGKPARLQLIQVGPMAMNPNAAPNGAEQVQQVLQQQAAMPQPAPPASFAIWHITGKGRHRLELAIRVKLERRGGWRLANALVPAAPVTAWTVTVPAARTEVRLAGILDRGAYETAADNQQIQTALTTDGTIDLQWRPKVAEGQVDRSLTVNSEAVLDVQEDGLHLVWQLTFAFPRSRRDAFSVSVPAGYLVEKVIGSNVRGWEVKPDENRQKLDVTLLKEVPDGETLTLHLSRRGFIKDAGATDFESPVVSVTDAMLHKGRLTIRRSPQIELRTMNSSGLSRTDVSDDAIAGLRQISAADESPLGLQNFQAFQFGATPFTLAMNATPLPAQTAAYVQALLRIAERETALEARFVIQPARHPVHRVRVKIPANLKIERVVAPGEFQWSESTGPAGRVLSVYLAAGQPHSFPVVVEGSLGRRQAADPVTAPNFEVLDVVRQQGDIVVQADPAFTVGARDLTNCSTILLDQTFGWLTEAQRPLARLALRYTRPNYAAAFDVTPRQPQVNAFSISNVKVTDVAVEETVIFDFTIHNAGIRRIEFLLPDWMRNAKVNAPLLRQKTITDVGNGSGKIRVRLDLQDEVTGQYRVLVEHDRLLAAGDANAETSAVHTAPIPVLETGRTDARYVTLENASRDEVVVTEALGLEPLSRSQPKWDALAAILGDAITTAYLAGEGDATKLSYQTKVRKTVETAGARIGLAETLLIVDANGAYRGQQLYYVNNTIEQYLEIQLPAGAELWTAQVAGEPVKPTLVPVAGAAATGANAAPATNDKVRIPLIKTAEGDRDYVVTLKYGGRLSQPLAAWSSIRFPLMKTLNINVELSRVKLRLPEDFRWMNFGGTMRRVVDQGDYEADYILYCTNEVKRLSLAFNSENPFTKVRANNNLKNITLAMQGFHDTYKAFPRNETLDRNVRLNAQVIEQAEQQTAEFLVGSSQSMEVDNRDKLNYFFEGQSNGLARNVVTGLGGNFPAASSADGTVATTGTATFNQGWLETNKLGTASVVVTKTAEEDQSKAGELTYESNTRFSKGMKVADAKSPEVVNLYGNPAQTDGGDKSGEQAGGQQAGGKSSKFNRAQLSQQELTNEYRSRLEMNQAQSQSQPEQAQAGQAQWAAGMGEQQAQPQANFSRSIRDSQLGIPANSDFGSVANAPNSQGGAIYAQNGLPAGGSGPVTGQMGGGGGLGGGGPMAPGGAPAYAAEYDMEGESVAPFTSTHLASLDVELPVRGVEFMFTTPRGDLEITATAVSSPLLARLTHLGLLLAGLLGIYLLARLCCLVCRRLKNTWLGTTLLLVAGAASLIAGVFPVLGLVLLTLAIVRSIRHFRGLAQSKSAAAAAA